jgi:Kef-type K+ transport system membrane component KefB
MSNHILTYEEPGTTQFLEITLLLLSLNLINHILNKWIYCGLVGQILIGTALGSPGANLFGIETEKAVLNLGYIGLMLLVYEGEISFPSTVGSLFILIP